MSNSQLLKIKGWNITTSTILAVIVLVYGGYTLAYAERVMPRVWVGQVALGGMRREQAQQTIEEHLAALRTRGIVVRVGDIQQVVRLENINFSVSTDDITDQAWNVGRTGPWQAQMTARLAAPILSERITPNFSYDVDALVNEIKIIAGLVSYPRKDVALVVKGNRVTVSYETQAGNVLDQGELRRSVIEKLEQLDGDPLALELRQDIPHIDPASAPLAQRQAEAMISATLSLSYDWRTFVISREQIGKWIISIEEGGNLKPVVDTQALSVYVTTLADTLNIAAQKPVIEVDEGKVSHFVPPRAGRALQESETLALIVRELETRRDSGKITPRVELPVQVTKPIFDTAQNLQGITELIGKATTPFTGSSTNRVSNIKNGTKFLSGTIIKPGEEFSTLKTLGTVDNTTGYLPELVIKESATIPEFGGGLCQVSTTLFRAALNAGLPITERRNHSFRVAYYEKDAKGNFIGPGLDATIYDVYPDLKFKNNTANPILIYGYVERDRLTFELYGTSDGRVATVEGPKLVTEIPPGEPIYRDTNQLPKGVVKQKEFARPGGTTIATYTVTYPDGRKEKQEFKSFYKRWPDQFLVGTGPAVTQ
ncbi:MAG: VanW family protein [Patescibacteria group bacterium]